jgi:hypothetical protein
MNLLSRIDPHARFRELLSLQLDEPLALDDAWALSIHLSSCDRCATAGREFKEQRRLLHGLGQINPPRDLGARTSAALDREVLRRRRGVAGGRVLWPAGPSIGRPTVAGTSAVVSLAALAIGSLAVLSGLPLALPDPTRLRPTPLEVPGQALAYLGAGPAGLSIYRTSVDRVCPASAIDCVERHDEGALLALSRPMRPSSLALSPSGERLAISAHDAEGEQDVFAIVLMPAAPTPTPDGAVRTPAPPSDLPATPTAVIASPPDPTGAVEPSQDVTPTPVEPPASAPPATPAVATPLVPVESPAATLAALTVVAILEDVRAAGAAPAWSADGSVLAFSAMPADGRHGPDLYAWQPGDETARAVTSDHGTYFASWSGARVVVSRTSLAAAETDAPAIAAVETVIIDPATADEVVVEGPAMWLPQVNGPRSHAIAWQGTLEWAGATVRPVEGELFLVDWAQLDPFAGADPATPAEPTEPAATEDPGPTPATDSSASPPAPPDGPGATPTLRPPQLLTLPPDSRPSEPAISPTTSEPAPTQTPPTPDADEATPAPSATPSTPLLRPLEPARDAAAQPVLDWEVRWAPDGAALGYWIADVPTASWGRLTVVPLDPASGELGTGTPLLAPTLARRSFTLGHSRVAWVGPAETTPEGELRISVWGPDGSGVLRFSAPDMHGVLAAF